MNGRPGAGLSAAGRLQVTLVRVTDPAQPAGGAAPAGPGGRLVAAQLDIQNLTAAAATVPVAASMTVVDDEDQSFQAQPGAVAGCAELAAAPVLAPGAKVSGCVGFPVPAATTLTKVTFALPDGSDTLSWRLR